MSEELTIQELSKAAKLIAKQLVDEIIDSGGMFLMGKRDIVQELFYRTSDYLEFLSEIKYNIGGDEYFDWYKKMWETPKMEKLINKFLRDIEKNGYDHGVLMSTAW